ncbi:MAG: beta-carotene 15,15'-dioxygenase, Brp/Blh family [Alphaproteobacteria bacterium]|jgi:Brp/Blh family beta-carotene 15,15'-monooxygenase|nr:beta-carotene 15,15'-dioxygenase, Brp/Blh family [Alphaproteobacteria bacterium]
MLTARKTFPGGYAFLVAALVVLAAAPWLNTLAPSARIAIALTAIAVVGLPHGAGDAWLAARHGLLSRPAPAMLFLGGYVMLAGLVILIWLAAPVISLAVFLLVSAWHFGGDFARNEELVRRLSAGVALLGAPALFWPDAVASIYMALSGEAAEILVGWQSHLFVPACLVFFAVSLLPRPDSSTWRPIFEMGALILLAAALTPLLWFTVYFAGLHSPRHFKGLFMQAGPGERARLAGLSALATLASLVFGVCAAILLVSSGVEINDALVNVIFVGLAALTVPHMALVDGRLLDAPRAEGASR